MDQQIQKPFVNRNNLYVSGNVQGKSSKISQAVVLTGNLCGQKARDQRLAHKEKQQCFFHQELLLKLEFYKCTAFT